MKKMIAIVVAALAVASCDRETKGRGTAAIAFAPTPSFGLQFSPQTLPIAGFTMACASNTVFTTGFDLVLVQTGRANIFLDRVTLRLNDGSNVGGPLITFPRQQLNTMFGSTLVAGSRAFPFRPQFGCGQRRPGSISADVLLLDEHGSSRSVSVSAAFQ